MAEWGFSMKYKYDKLTGLYNRAWAEQYIGKCFKKKKLISAAIIDIDFFANINEKIGNENGDDVLKRIAGFLSMNKEAAVARYGGDEFIIIYVDISIDKVIEHANNLKQDFKLTHFVTIPPYEKAPVKFSMGIASSSINTNGTFLLLKSAEIALSKAKKNGRNRIELADDKKMHFLKNNGICTTIVGRSLKGNCKDGTDAYFASIAEPYGVELDLNDDLLIVDRSNHQIKRVHNKRICTIAGCGQAGYSGDGRSAKRSRLCKPSGVAVHKTGKMYIADTGNHRIRMVENGVISTVAGNGECGYSGDGNSALNARLNRPGGIVADDEGNLYTNDYGNNVIRKIDINGIIATIAGSGEFGYEGDNSFAILAKLDKPYGLCISLEGKTLYLADYGNHCIREVDLKSGIIKTLCGTGEPGYSGDGDVCYKAKLNGPFWVCLYDYNLLIADANNHCIRKINLSTKIITTIIGNGKAGYVDDSSDISKVRLNIPAGMTQHGNNLYIADYGNNAIRKVIRT